jgi:methionyl aminopeptidase
MVIAIEPMVNIGRGSIDVAEDGWTVFAKDLSASAHFEHSIVIRNGKAELLSTFNFIEN